MHKTTYCNSCNKVYKEVLDDGKGFGLVVDSINLCPACESIARGKWDMFNQIAELLKKDNAGICEITPKFVALAGKFTVDELQNIVNFMKLWEKNT